MSRCLIISADSHAGAPWELYGSYMEARYRDDYDRYITALTATYESGGRMQTATGKNLDPQGKSIREAFANSPSVQGGGLTGAWDIDVRARELDREGVAAEVLFPDGQNRNSYPFSKRAPAFGEISPELKFAGAQAHNRWLAEFCSQRLDRLAGVAVVLPFDIEAAVDEIRWARKANLYGGIQLPGIGLYASQPELFWNHPRYDPIWSTCEELDMPVHLHHTLETAQYDGMPGAIWITSSEIMWLSRRPTWFMIWGGVLDRHPKLKFVNTEAGGSWVPNTLDLFDYLWEVRNPEAAREWLKMKPSEYWRRQCYIGASPPAGRLEIDLRHQIGVENLMWGSDYPHLAGNWPWSLQRLRELFVEVPEAETRKILGENAVRVYGFDWLKLAAIAAKIAPTVEALTTRVPGIGTRIRDVQTVTPSHLR